jgi:hypothetical protein
LHDADIVKTVQILYLSPLVVKKPLGYEVLEIFHELLLRESNLIVDESVHYLAYLDWTAEYVLKLG